MEGGGFWKKIICYFSYPSTPLTLLMLESPNKYAWYPYARITKQICMIPLCIQMLATYLKFFSDFQFLNNSEFSDFTQKCNFSVNYSWNCLKIGQCMGDVICIIHCISNGFIMWLSDHPQKSILNSFLENFYIYAGMAPIDSSSSFPCFRIKKHHLKVFTR